MITDFFIRFFYILKKYFFILVLGLIVVLSVLYFFSIRIFPEFYRDDYSMTKDDIKWQIYNAQEDFYKKNKHYSEILDKLELKISPTVKTYWGWKSDFSNELSRLCSDCLYYADKYKVLVVEEKNNKLYVSSVSNYGDFKLIGKFNRSEFKKILEK